jgi:hypothetical protein
MSQVKLKLPKPIVSESGTSMKEEDVDLAEYCPYLYSIKFAIVFKS